MGLAEDLASQVTAIFRTPWQVADTVTVPDTPDVALSHGAKVMNAAVLYADLADSTTLVEVLDERQAAEVYKSYLYCACTLIEAHKGVVTAFDGDRVMGVFLGSTKEADAATCALRINWTVVHLLNPTFRQRYPTHATHPGFAIRHGVGVDASRLFVARIGRRGANDLVWIGRAANIAAKLCSLRQGDHATFITKAVYDKLPGPILFDNHSMRWEAVPVPSEMRPDMSAEARLLAYRRGQASQASTTYRSRTTMKP